MRRALPAILLTVAVTSATAGCAGSAGTPAGGAATAIAEVAAPRTPPPVPTSGLTRGMSLPLEAYEETLPEYTAILEARLALEKACMSGYGFAFAPRADTDAISYDVSNMARRYGLSDPAEAAAYGYAVPTVAATPQPALSPQESLVLNGTSGTYDGKAVPAGGCAGEADRQLADPANGLLVDQLDQQSMTESLTLPTVNAAIGQWADCMRHKGYQATSPLTASLLAGQSGDRKVALADVACKESTNLIGIWFSAESSVQRKYIAVNEDRLRRDAAALAAARDKAESVLAR